MTTRKNQPESSRQLHALGGHLARRDLDGAIRSLAAPLVGAPWNTRESDVPSAVCPKWRRMTGQPACGNPIIHKLSGCKSL